VQQLRASGWARQMWLWEPNSLISLKDFHNLGHLIWKQLG
jgi:hypothetical protein